MGLLARHLWRTTRAVSLCRVRARSFAGLLVACASLLAAAMPAVAAPLPTFRVMTLGSGAVVTEHAGTACPGTCSATFASLSLRSRVTSARALPVPHLAVAAQAQPTTSAGYQCVPYSQYRDVHPRQSGSVSTRLAGYTVTYTAGPSRYLSGLAYPGVLTVSEGDKSWLLPRPADPEEYLHLASLCAVRFEAGQVPAVLAESSTGGQCCLVPSIYAYSTSARKYVMAEDFTKPGAGRGLHWQPDAGFTPEKVGNAVVLMSYDAAFQFSFGCYACNPLPTRLFTLTDDRLVDVTLQYPSVIRTEKDAAWKEAQKYMRSSDRAAAVEEAVLQWAADSCELGEGASMWRTVERLETDGVFTEAEQYSNVHGPFRAAATLVTPGQRVLRRPAARFKPHVNLNPENAYCRSHRGALGLCRR